MSILSLFENEKLATILGQVIRNERPKSDLEKTEWWNEMVCESLVNREVADFIKIFWPTINPRFILSELRDIGDNYKRDVNWAPEKPKIHDCLKDVLIDTKLIEIIKEERGEIFRKAVFKIPASGPKPKVVNQPTKEGSIDCVAMQQSETGNIVVYQDIYKFLLDWSNDWIENCKIVSPNVNCGHQEFTNISEKENQEKDWEIAEIIFSNFPKAFDYCEKDYYLYICGINWNCDKYKQVNGELVPKKKKKR